MMMLFETTVSVVKVFVIALAGKHVSAHGMRSNKLEQPQ